MTESNHTSELFHSTKIYKLHACYMSDAVLVFGSTNSQTNLFQEETPYFVWKLTGASTKSLDQ